MKKILLFSILFFAASTTFAQSSYTSLSPEAEKQCTELTRSMTSMLQLNELEYIKLKALNRELFVKTSEIVDKYKNDKETRESKLQELEESFEKNLKSFLTPMQLYSFSQYKKQGNLNFVATIADYE